MQRTKPEFFRNSLFFEIASSIFCVILERIDLVSFVPQSKTSPVVLRSGSLILLENLFWWIFKSRFSSSFFVGVRIPSFESIGINVWSCLDRARSKSLICSGEKRTFMYFSRFSWWVNWVSGVLCVQVFLSPYFSLQAIRLCCPPTIFCLIYTTFDESKSKTFHYNWKG